MDDDTVARIIAEEARRDNRESSRSFSRQREYSEPKVINKTYLLNTVQSVESHNRRDQIDGCWRWNDLQKRAISNSESDSQQRIDSVRDQWALRKLKALVSRDSNSAPAVSVDCDRVKSRSPSSSSSSDSSSDDSSTSGRHKSRRKKHHRKNEKKRKTKSKKGDSKKRSEKTSKRHKH